jgi:N-acetylglutamate synthase-like GNAT family acetyltransferase
MEPTTRLVTLPERAECLPSLLAWNLQVWGERIPGYDVAGWRAFYQRCLAADYRHYSQTSELTWVIEIGGACVGGISLVYEDDLPDFTHLSPWLAAFVIDPGLRGRGIGTEAVRLFESMVRGFGITRLYLWTDSETHWYEGLGYSVMERSRVGDIEMDVMVKEL